MQENSRPKTLLQEILKEIRELEKEPARFSGNSHSSMYNTILNIREKLEKLSGILEISRELPQENARLEQIEKYMMERDDETAKAQRMAGVGTWIYYPRGDYVHWSLGLYHIFERDPSLGPPQYEEHMAMTDPVSWRKFEKVIQEAIERGASYELEMPVYLPDGRTKWVISRGEAEKDDKGEVVRIKGYTHDITAFKKIRDSLHEKEMQYRLFTENAGDMICVLDKAMADYIYISPTVERLLGYTPEEMKALSVDELLMPESCKEIQKAVKDRLEKAKQGIMEDRTLTWQLEYIKKNGEPVWLETTTRPFFDKEGNFLGLVGVSRDITDRKITENALRASEKQYRSLVEMMQEGIWVIDENAKTTFVNPFMAKLFEYAPHEMMGRHLFDFMDEEWKTKCAENLRRRKSGISEPHEFSFRTGSGKAIQVHMHTRPLFDDAGAYKGAFAVVSDITEKKEAEEKRRMAYEQLQRIIDNLPSLIILKDTDGKYRVANALAEKLLRLPRGGMIGKTDYEIFPRETADKYATEDRIIKETGISLSMEEEMELPGETRTFIIHKFPLHDTKGGVYAICGMATDISERKEMEEKLRKERKRLDTVFNSIPGFVYIQRPDYSIWETNAEFRRLFGKPNGAPCYRHIGNMDAPCNPCPTFEVFKTGKSVSWEWQDGKGQTWQIYDVPFFDEKGGPLVLELGFDITERKEMERELVYTKEEAEAANLSKSAFLANMSHELRTPLNAVLGYSAILKQDKTLSARQNKAASIIHSSGNHLLTLINDILDLSRIEAGKLDFRPASFYLLPFLNDIAGFFSLRAEEKDLEFESDFAPDLPKWMFADEKRLRQVLLNLLSNAIKYTKTGKVTFRAAPENDGEKNEKGCNVVFTVKDTGVGIPEEMQEIIFMPFQQLKTETGFEEGTGLGLSISRKLVELMGGKLMVQSKTGKGSTFTFCLPFEKTTQEDAPEFTCRKSIIGYRGVKRTLLVVDDRMINRDLIRTFLLPLGFDILEAENGKEALGLLGIPAGKENLEQEERTIPNQVQETGKQVDMVLLDIIMPEMDGFSVLKSLRSHPETKSMKVTAVSADITPETMEKFMAMGGDDFITKPVNFQTLTQALETHLGITWTYQSPNHDDPDKEDEEEMETEQPSSEELEEMYKMARIGDILGIEKYAEKKMDERPETKGFYKKILACTEKLDIQAVRDLIGEWK